MRMRSWSSCSTTQLRDVSLKVCASEGNNIQRAVQLNKCLVHFMKVIDYCVFIALWSMKNMLSSFGLTTLFLLSSGLVVYGSVALQTTQTDI